MTRLKKPNKSIKRKMSEMISEMAAGFLGVGDTLGERQNRLRSPRLISWGLVLDQMATNARPALLLTCR
jgi:hypothetical protein